MSFERIESSDAAAYITSLGNPLVKELHKLATDSTAYTGKAAYGWRAIICVKPRLLGV